MNADRMKALVNELARVKSRQDADAAVALQHADMVLEAPAMNAKFVGRESNRQGLIAFFRAFPDYHVMLDGLICDDTHLVAWGNIRMTLTSDRLGVAPTGRTAEIPAFLRFGFKDDLIASEYFFYDLSAACAQWGVSVDAMRERLFTQTRAS